MTRTPIASPPAPGPTRRPREAAYSATALAGLLYLAFHSLARGAVDPAQALAGPSLARGLPEAWPYLALAAGVAARRGWARDLAAPLALLSLAASVAALPRYAFLALAAGRDPRVGAAAGLAWRLLHRQFALECVPALLAAGTLYALTRPDLRARPADGSGPGWTAGLGFAACLALVWALLTASRDADQALYRLQDFSGSPADWGALGGAALSVAVLVGLARRRPWGLALGPLLALTEGSSAFKGALRAGAAASASALGPAPAAARFYAMAAFCAHLPALVSPILALAALAALAARRLSLPRTRPSGGRPAQPEPSPPSIPGAP